MKFRLGLTVVVLLSSASPIPGQEGEPARAISRVLVSDELARARGSLEGKPAPKWRLLVCPPPVVFQPGEEWSLPDFTPRPLADDEVSGKIVLLRFTDRQILEPC